MGRALNRNSKNAVFIYPCFLQANFWTSSVCSFFACIAIWQKYVVLQKWEIWLSLCRTHTNQRHHHYIFFFFFNFLNIISSFFDDMLPFFFSSSDMDSDFQLNNLLMFETQVGNMYMNTFLNWFVLQQKLAKLEMSFTRESLKAEI